MIETANTEPADMEFLNSMLENLHIRVGTRSIRGIIFYWLRDEETGFDYRTSDPALFDHELEAAISARN